MKSQQCPSRAKLLNLIILECFLLRVRNRSSKEDPNIIIFLSIALILRTIQEVFNKEELHSTISLSKLSHLIQRKVLQCMKAKA